MLGRALAAVGELTKEKLALAAFTALLPALPKIIRELRQPVQEEIGQTCAPMLERFAELEARVHELEAGARAHNREDR